MDLKEYDNNLCYKCLKGEGLTVPVPQLITTYFGCDKCFDRDKKSYKKSEVINQIIESRR